MSINVGDVVASVMRHYTPKLHDNISNHNVFGYHLKKDGRVKDYVHGGRNISESVLYGTNSSVKFFDGYETFVPPTDDQDVIDFAEYEWKQLAGFVAVNSREEMLNRGEAQIRDFVKTRLEHLKANLSNTYATSLYSDGTGTGGKEIGGLQLLVADDPTAAGTVGGIDQSAQSFWRNQTSTVTATVADIEGQMLDIWNNTIRGQDRPTRIYASADMYKLYWSALVDKRRYTSASEAEGSFKGLAFESASVYFDDQCPTKHMYFLNLNDLTLRTTIRDVFKVCKSRDIPNALYSVTPVEAMMNLTTGRRASHAVLIDD